MVSKNVNVKIDTVKMDDRVPWETTLRKRSHSRSFASGMKTRRSPCLMQSVEGIKKYRELRH